MKFTFKLIITSLIIGVCLTLAGLFKYSGARPPMLPCGGLGRGCGLGVAPIPPTINNVGQRGWPLPIIYLQLKTTDGYVNEGAYAGYVYEGYSIIGIFYDLAIFTIIGFGITLLLQRYTKIKFLH